MADSLNYIDTFTDLLRQAICLISQMKHEEYILALKQWQIADSMVQSLTSQFDVLASAHAANEFGREDDNDSVDSAKIREQIDLMVEEFPEENEKNSSWTIFNDTFLMFSDEELETIFRKAFIRSKSKSPSEETQLMTQDWSNQICDSSKAMNGELRRDEAMIAMSFSDSSNPYTSSSDTESLHPGENYRESSGELNHVEASVNITTIQQSSSNTCSQLKEIKKEMKTSLSKDHTVLASLLEQKTDGAKSIVTSTNQSKRFEIPFDSSSSVCIAKNDDLSIKNDVSLGSNITRLSQSNDLNNFKIEIVMELDKGMANGRNVDSKYKIKIGPEHFNSLFVNDLPKRVEKNSSSVYVESFSSSETISSSYQVKSNNHLSSCDNNQYDKILNVFQKNSFIDIANGESKASENEKNNQDHNDKELAEKDIHDSKTVMKKRKSSSEVPNFNKKHTSKNKHDRPRKQYNRNNNQTSKKQDNDKDKYKKQNAIDYSPDEESVFSDKNCNEIVFKSPQVSPSKTDVPQNRIELLGDLRNPGELNESCEMKETFKDSSDNINTEDDDDVVVLEEKNMQPAKHDIGNDIHVVKSDTTSLANNFFLISNDATKDKQNVKYLILNNNNLFKTLNFDCQNKTIANGNIVSNENGQQSNLLLLNNDKNGNLFLLNKDVTKQTNSFVLNTNSIYNSCETQYFIINDTNTNFQQMTDSSQTNSVTTTDNTFNFTSNCDSPQLMDPPQQIKIAMDTPIDIQDNDGSIKSCVRQYDTQLDCDKNMENTTVMPMLSQDSNSATKDLIQNKENILVLNNHVNEEHFKFDSNDSSVQIRLDDSMYYLNEKISNELKMGGGGKCSEIPQIYFINESPLSSEFCVDNTLKDTPTCSDQFGNQSELFNFNDSDLDKLPNPSASHSSAVEKDSINSNLAQSNDKYALPLFKTSANNSLNNDKVKLLLMGAANANPIKNASPENNLKSDAKIKPVPVKSKLTPLKQNSSSFLKHLKSKLEKERPVSKNQILNKVPSNYLHKNAPIVKKKKKLDDMDSVLTNDPVENASKILALCMQKESEAQQKSLTCHICSMVFCDEKVLNKHVQEHSTLGKSTCTVCKKVFNNMKTLKTHSRIHTGEKPFRCSVCGKSFSQRGILSSHLAVHAGVKPHVCKQCGHAFTQKSQLRLHEMRHGNIRQFACSVCPFKFTTKSDLQRHQRSHEGVKPFSCDYCDKTFTRQIMMKEHLNRHKGVQPYSCSYCDRTFFDAQSLNKHKLIHKTASDRFKSMDRSDLFGGVSVGQCEI